MGIHIYAKIDEVMEMLMKKLEIPIPQFKLKRHAELKFVGKYIECNGIDLSGSPY